MTRVMSLSSLGGSVVLDGSTGVQAKIQMRGTGLPPVSTQWFEGAGDGASFRGGRNLARVMDMTIKVFSGDGRAAVRDRLSLLGRIFSLRAGDVRLTANLDGDEWFVDVRRTGGGDFDWEADTDSVSYIKTVITLQAGDPYWTQLDQESQKLTTGGTGRGLLKAAPLSNLELSTTTALGVGEIENTGDVPVFGVWTIKAPFSGFELTSPFGESLLWGTAGDGVPGAVKGTGFIVVNMELGTAVDESGANAYGGFGPVPRFWAVEPGVSEVGVLVNDPTGDTEVLVIWNPKRWVMF